MGSGKGAPELWVARVKPGRIMFELDGVTDAVAREALQLMAGLFWDLSEAGPALRT